jgi:hypothetical protein
LNDALERDYLLKGFTLSVFATGAATTTVIASFDATTFILNVCGPSLWAALSAFAHRLASRRCSLKARAAS